MFDVNKIAESAQTGILATVQAGQALAVETTRTAATAIRTLVPAETPIAGFLGFASTPEPEATVEQAIGFTQSFFDSHKDFLRALSAAAA